MSLLGIIWRIMERLGMEQNSTTEEIKSNVDKTPSRENLSPWLVTSLVLFLISLVPVIYYF
ncbi:hypothetical protein JZU71_00995, partial [bacterium]|nr:hypothetical protein [bacterium]